MPGKQERANALLQNLDCLLGGESSVELVHTTKGDTWKVKVYNNDAGEALRIANKLFEECRNKYGEASK
ncbi:MAG: hypothetical protein JSW60_07405 [Thermoplasmatales archaeon]|nr:MAG: hypothetical protein JSW60_07405 [Thermoplasmatales archaeon]